MRKVITYGTFDMFHHGHYNLLKRAKALGDYLIVGITSDNYDQYRGKLNVKDNVIQRIESVRRTGLADEIIVEEYEGQKIDDIIEKGADVFAIGSDWVGRFDYLKDYCEVIYLERTRGISSTELRNQGHELLLFAIIGTGRIAHRFIPESKFVSGMVVDSVFNVREQSAKAFANRHELSFYSNDLDTVLQRVDAVYIASPHATHYEYAKKALLAGKHVLCEKPMVLQTHEANELFTLANSKALILMEGIKTLHCPGFQRLVSLAKSGRIGDIKCVDASFTKLVPPGCREVTDLEAGGSMTELSTYPALAIYKFLGLDYEDVRFTSYRKDKGVDLFTKIDLVFKKAVASAKVGIGAKTEGSLVITGTRGYIYVPAPWWKTDYFEMRFEDTNLTQKFFYEFIGDGLRYELVAFIKQIINQKPEPMYQDCSIEICKLIDEYRSGAKTRFIQ
ncbi:MAG: Gfo/Idh/MocA family oxidoreductase [Christensenellales bacterium]|jgi:glycerol-3-phosphate cytidylyltransferase